MPTLALLISHDGTILEAGPAADALLGTHAGPVAGSRLQERVAPEERASVETWLHGAGDAPLPARLNLTRDAAGATVAVDAVAAPLDTQGTPTRRVCVLSWGEAPAPSTEELRQLQRLGALGQLAGGLAHDLNNFLTAILGYSSLALMKTDATDPRHRMLAPLKECSERAAALAHRMLSFSRTATGARRPLGVRQLVDDSLSMVRPALPRGVELRVTLPDRELWTVGDPVQLEQVLVNLCVNARDALGGEGTLTLHAERVWVDAGSAARRPRGRVGSHVAIDVIDTGGGIPPDILPRIFEPFFTTKAPGSGTGLGLANVAEIVAEHEGFIEVTSHPGEGTRFRVHLPEGLAPATDEDEAAPRALATGVGTALVVAGDDAIRHFVREVLTHAGYEVIAAVNGGEALLVFGMHRDVVRVVVLDDGIAPLGGRDCGAMLRDVNAEVALVRLGAARDEGESAPATVHLEKPCDAAALAAAVASVLEA